ncbi:hypothetical protein EON64_20190, partial [archaeon]
MYNEQLKDLLSNDPMPLTLQHHPKHGTVISGLRHDNVTAPEQVMKLLELGETHRHVGSTDMNEKSSRAHTIFKMMIESSEKGKASNALVRHSSLHLVDLAGSESAKLTNSKGERQREAKYINQSLLTLSTIIHRLSEGRGKGHLPYRDSKLTRLLECTLDGNARIAIICTVSPAIRCAEESNNTLKFASRAKLVKMQASISESQDDKTLLRNYRLQIEELQNQLKIAEHEKQAAMMRVQQHKEQTGGEGNGTEEDSMASRMELLESLSQEQGQSEERTEQIKQLIAGFEGMIIRGETMMRSLMNKTKGRSVVTPKPGQRKEMSAMMSPRFP